MPWPDIDTKGVLLPPHARFHHIGWACESIERDQAQFGRLGFRAEGPAFSDPTQGIRGLFLVGAGPRIELLENLPGAQTLSPLLARGVRMYHLAYTVPDMQAALAATAAAGGKTLVGPVPAVAFGMRPIAFVMFRHGLMLEFIEDPTAPQEAA